MASGVSRGAREARAPGATLKSAKKEGEKKGEKKRKRKERKKKNFLMSPSLV